MRHKAETWSRWRGLVAEQRASGKSVAAFCRERGVPVSQVFAWRRRLRAAETAPFVEVEVKPSFEPVQVAPVRRAAIEVRLARGRSLVVEPGFDADHLHALLTVLEAEA